MPILVFFFAVAICGGWYASQSVHVQTVAEQQAEIQALAGNMSVLRNSLAAFAEANPGFNGEVADSSLPYPSWFRRMSTVRNVVAGGVGYVYVTNPPAGLASEIVRRSDGSIRAGYSRNGMLESPLHGATSISLPALIPNGSVVFVCG